MVSINSYRDLDAWKLGIEIATAAYELTKSFPREEQFGLTSQIRRAAVSIPANIAEGHGRQTTGDFVRGIRIAQGSLKELETHVLVAQRVGIVQTDATQELMDLCEREGRVLRALARSLQDTAE